MRSILLSLTALALLAPSSVSARAQPVDPNSIKAAIVFNLIRYIEFPKDMNESVQLCALRGVEGAAAMSNLNGRRAGSRSIAYRLVDNVPAGGCDVLFVGDAGSKDIARARRRGTVLIGDSPDFIGAGGTIGLIRNGSQVRFEINAKAAREADVTLSSRLMRLAVRIDQ